MHVLSIDHRHAGPHLALLAEMFRMRRRVFKDRLDWTVSVSGDFEIDIYDALNPTHLMAISDANEVLGCVRLLPSTGPNMLADTFPFLLGGGRAPCCEDILESSRFCVDTDRACELGRGSLNRVTFVLFAAMIEAMRARGARAIATVTDTRMERILRRAGWPIERLAEPRPLGQTTALAGLLYNSEHALAAMYRQAGIEGPVLVVPGVERRAA